MADKKNEDPKTEEKPVGIDKAGVLKLLRDRKIEIVGRKSVSERDVLSFADLGDRVVVVTSDGRKHTLKK